MRTFKKFVTALIFVSVVALATPAMANCPDGAANCGNNNGGSNRRDYDDRYYNNNGTSNNNCANNGCGNNGGSNYNSNISLGDVPAILAVRAGSELFQGLRERSNIAKSRDATIAINNNQGRVQTAVDAARAAEARSFYLLQWETQNGGGRATAGAPTGNGGPQTDLNDCINDKGTIRCATRR